MTTTTDEYANETMIISFLTLRRLVGILGVALPFLLVLGALIVFRTGPQSSISSYYHTGMRDVFVGLVCVIGCVLFSYKGYCRLDSLISNLAGFFAVGVALFPTTPDGPVTDQQARIGIVHITCATLFFLSLAWFSFAIFTRTSPGGEPTARKLARNRVYRTCGVVILGCILAMVACSVMDNALTRLLAPGHPILLLESLADITFGISWMTKGQMLLQDLPAVSAAPEAVLAEGV